MSKTVLITGCASGGMGFALATEFHRRGHRVIATVLEDCQRQELENAGIQTVTMDVTSQPSIDAAVSHASKLTDGTLNILVNNAGQILLQPLADTTVAEFRRILEVNTVGVFAVTRACLPLLLEAARRSGGDSVVASQGSVNGVLAPPFMAAYNASKAAVEALGNTVRTELAPLGVRVVTLRTGPVRTELFRNALPARLPEGSLYEAVRENVGDEPLKKVPRWLWMEPEVYARGVVDELLRPVPKKIVWRGPLTTFSWIVSWFWVGILATSGANGD